MSDATIPVTVEMLPPTGPAPSLPQVLAAVYLLHVGETERVTMTFRVADAGRWTAWEAA